MHKRIPIRVYLCSIGGQGMNFILLCGEFAQVTPAGMAPDVWRAELRDIADQLTASCREVDPASTDEAIQLAHESGHRWNTDKHG